MSQEEAVQKGLRLVPVWAPIVWAVVAGVFGSGATFATLSGSIGEMRDKVKQVDDDRKENQAYVLQFLERMNSKLDDQVQRQSRIEGALNK